MLVFMARETIPRKAEKRAIQVLYLDLAAFGRRNMGGRVALLAGEARVLPLQNIASLAVVELFLRRVPVNQLEGLAVVLGMAARAVLLTGGHVDDCGVIAALRSQALSDLGVAAQTLQIFPCSGREPVARDALRGPAQGLMRAG